jgi:hypothetical protein
MPQTLRTFVGKKRFCGSLKSFLWDQLSQNQKYLKSQILNYASIRLYPGVAKKHDFHGLCMYSENRVFADYNSKNRFLTTENWVWPKTRFLRYMYVQQKSGVCGLQQRKSFFAKSDFRCKFCSNIFAMSAAAYP